MICYLPSVFLPSGRALGALEVSRIFLSALTAACMLFCYALIIFKRPFNLISFPWWFGIKLLKLGHIHSDHTCCLKWLLIPLTKFVLNVSKESIILNLSYLKNVDPQQQQAIALYKTVSKWLFHLHILPLYILVTVGRYKAQSFRLTIYKLQFGISYWKFVTISFFFNLGEFSEYLSIMMKDITQCKNLKIKFYKYINITKFRK